MKRFDAGVVGPKGIQRREDMAKGGQRDGRGGADISESRVRCLGGKLSRDYKIMGLDPSGYGSMDHF